MFELTQPKKEEALQEAIDSYGDLLVALERADVLKHAGDIGYTINMLYRLYEDDDNTESSELAIDMARGGIESAVLHAYCAKFGELNPELKDYVGVLANVTEGVGAIGKLDRFRSIGTEDYNKMINFFTVSLARDSRFCEESHVFERLRSLIMILVDQMQLHISSE